MESCQGSSRERVAPPLIFREQGKTYPITIARRAENFTISTVTSSPPNLFIFYLRLFIRHTLRAVFIERAVSINNRGVAEKKKFLVSLPPTNSQLLDGVSKVGTRQTAQSFGGLLQVLADEGRGEEGITTGKYLYVVDP